MRKERRKNGFSVIEFMIVIAILGILAALMIPNFINREKCRCHNEVREELQRLAGMATQYTEEHAGYYPTNIGVLSYQTPETSKYSYEVAEVKGTQFVTLRAIGRDGFVRGEIWTLAINDKGVGDPVLKPTEKK